MLCGADMFKICSYVYDKNSAVFRYFLTQIQSQLQVWGGGDGWDKCLNSARPGDKTFTLACVFQYYFAWLFNLVI